MFTRKRSTTQNISIYETNQNSYNLNWICFHWIEVLEAAAAFNERLLAHLSTYFLGESEVPADQLSQVHVKHKQYNGKSDFKHLNCMLSFDHFVQWQQLDACFAKWQEIRKQEARRNDFQSGSIKELQTLWQPRLLFNANVVKFQMANKIMRKLKTLFLRTGPSARGTGCYPGVTPSPRIPTWWRRSPWQCGRPSAVWRRWRQGSSRLSL